MYLKRVIARVCVRLSVVGDFQTNQKCRTSKREQTERNTQQERWMGERKIS